MPNITLYLTDRQYLDFMNLKEELKKEARDKATKQILRILNGGKLK